MEEDEIVIKAYPLKEFQEIKTLLYDLYGLDKIQLNSAIQNSKEILLYDSEKEGEVDSENMLYLPLQRKREYLKFSKFSKKYSIDCGSIVEKVLFFLYTFFPIEDPMMTNNDYWDYVTMVRPEMLKLYIALHNGKNKYRKKCRIIIGNNSIDIDKNRPWFQMALERYLDEYLGVNNVKEADRELRKIYGGKYGPKQHKEVVRLIWGTYHLLQMSNQFKSAPNDLLTNLQCRLISDLLIILGYLPSYEDDGVKVKARLYNYLKNYTTLDELLSAATEYRLSPNKKSSMDYY